MQKSGASALIAASVLSLFPAAASSHEFTIEVRNVRPGRGGQIVIEIWRRDVFAAKFPYSNTLPSERTNGAQGGSGCRWSDPSFTLCRFAVPVTSAADGKISKSTSLPSATYAFSVYHDGNRNWTLDIKQENNMLHYLEGIGASNGGELFDDAAIAIRNNAPISIGLYYDIVRPIDTP